MGAVIENDLFRLEVSPAGQGLRFIDKATGSDYSRSEKSPFARIRKDGREFAASEVTSSPGGIRVRFGDSKVEAVLRATPKKRHLVVEVVSLSGSGVEQLTFVNMPLSAKGQPDEPFAACALALNLRTYVSPLPGPTSALGASCLKRVGFAGAKVALIGCPQSELRDIMKEVVSEAEDLPHSPVGGPWALDGPDNYRSYLFNFDGITLENVGEWIRLAKSLGITQIDFHGGTSFRFGDCRPNPSIYPNGFDDLKAVIDKLHEAGIQAGLHTYAACIAKEAPWVTPVPDPRLGKDATFTLAEDMTESDSIVKVRESTDMMSTVTGFFVRNGLTIQVDDELMIFGGISKEPPYAFTSCQRGAYGTRVSAHAKGAKVHHLKECFFLFQPDHKTSLFAEVAAKSAEAFNRCGFDTIYLDALDAEDIFDGREYGWHYGSKFTFELFKRLERPALIEMSTFHHHLWYVRSRMGAWDHPTRSYKKFIDNHCAANENNKRIFMPSQLGWWAVKTWGGALVEPTFPDDIEYLCAKCLGNDTGLALMGIHPRDLGNPYMMRLAEVMRRWENLRAANVVPESIKARLREPGKDFTLRENAGKWTFSPTKYDKHRVEGMDGWSNEWTVANAFDRQPARLRIEALMSAAPYESPDAVTVADFDDPSKMPRRFSPPEITASLETVSDPVKVGSVSGEFTAESKLSGPRGAWSMVGRKWDTPIDLSAKQALGVWIHGDGSGAILNVQLRSPAHVSEALGEHYVKLDFTGWRYFELIEPEGERFADFFWPYNRPEAQWNDTWNETEGQKPHWIWGAYHIYRENVNFGKVEQLSLWYNNLPSGKAVTTYLSPIKALPLVNGKLVNPAITVGGKTINFPVEIESGCYLEFNSMTDCKLYGPQGALIREVKPEGDAPVLDRGDNVVSFNCTGLPGINPRARVTVISAGDPLTPAVTYMTP